MYIWYMLLTFSMLLLQYSGSGNVSAAEEGTSKEHFMDNLLEDNSALLGKMLCEKFQSCYCPDISREELSKSLEKMHKNEKLREILVIVRDYETPDEVLYQQLSGALEKVYLLCLIT